eukprot:TRINITY_DN32996_c0_g1_i2.p1 TRINITY_DN32996_c0_g1~~TRINITY_DN32996_c0_g1_i2.p1  ORF type:complete len:128 (-),score=12.65 TRINITY_DN32996_c0_g1_i2:244-627(-)
MGFGIDDDNLRAENCLTSWPQWFPLGHVPFHLLSPIILMHPSVPCGSIFRSPLIFSTLLNTVAHCASYFLLLCILLREIPMHFIRESPVGSTLVGKGGAFCVSFFLFCFVCVDGGPSNLEEICQKLV